jgi:hypothetical protein
MDPIRGPFRPEAALEPLELPHAQAIRGVARPDHAVGIAYNPKKVPRPKAWTDLLKDPGGRAWA